MTDSQTSSRIFVRGLPPDLSQDDFRKHFSVFSSITDTRVLPHRRIGYVGFETPQEAAKAVKHFNKSFIRMSKIGVEQAKPARAPNVAQNERSNFSKNEHVPSHPVEPITAGLEEGRGRKRKRDVKDSGTHDPKLKEFLEIMQPRPKAHQSLSTSYQESASQEQDPEQARPNLAHPSLSNEGHRRSQKSSRSGSGNGLAGEDEDLSKKNKQILDSVLLDNVEENKERADNPNDFKDAIDNDDAWLRNRTNRVLDLVDEEADRPIRHQDTESNADGDSNPAQASEQTYEETKKNNAWLTTPEESNPVEGEHSGDTDVDTIMSTGRLFVRNIAFNANMTNIESHFQGFGELEEVHLPLDPESGSNKGFCFVQFKSPEQALLAFRDLDSTIFQGRLLHVLPSQAKRDQGLDDYAISKLPIKKQRLVRRKAEAASSNFNWNSLYMNADAVISSVADRLGVPKSVILDPTSSDAAVKHAHAETHVIQETKAYFAEHGVNLDAFRTKERGNTAILAKNFPYEMKSQELKSLFEEHGEVIRLLVPPAGTIAIVEYAKAQQARNAFGSLAYRKVKDSVLFLEKAPKQLFEADPSKSTVSKFDTATFKPSSLEFLQGQETHSAIETSTLFIRNLNFDTSNKRLKEVFEGFDGFLSARVKTKTDPKRPGQVLSMGYGFAEFRNRSQAQNALNIMDGSNLDGHHLQIRASHKGIDAAAERRKEDQAHKAASRSTKIVIKNLPFETTKKDVRSLLGTYGQLRSVRVPKKFDKGSRGFAFAEFTSEREAENAMESLRNTHLLGRRLVLEFASAEPADAEAEIEKMQKKVGSQANKVALQKLTGNSRKKFNVAGNEYDNDQG